MTVELDIPKIILASLDKQGSDREPDGYYHPSEITACARKMYWEKTLGKAPNSKGKFSPKAKLSLLVGTAVHEILQNALLKNPDVTFRDEALVHDEDERILGHCDGIFTLADGTERLLEIKTAMSHYYQLFTRKPDRKHIIQMQMYMMVLGIEKGYLLYFNVDNKAMFQHTVLANKLFQERILAKTRHITESLEKGLPPTDFIHCEGGDWDKNCSHYMRCKNFAEGKPVI